MDAKSFCNFLKGQLKSDIQVFENNLLNAAYGTIEETKKAGGMREALNGMITYLDGKAMEHFYNASNNAAPSSSDMSVSPELPQE